MKTEFEIGGGVAGGNKPISRAMESDEFIQCPSCGWHPVRKYEHKADSASTGNAVKDALDWLRYYKWANAGRIPPEATCKPFAEVLSNLESFLAATPSGDAEEWTRETVENIWNKCVQTEPEALEAIARAHNATLRKETK